MQDAAGKKQLNQQQASVFNVNVGVLGHVDSGKTSLVAALSTVLSTAALDKHPQSKERGITLDLGFSSLQVPKPPHLVGIPADLIQFTLVDCPGHASLIRTILGGAQIIDVMLLVIDVTKGIQAQTAECLVVGEVMSTDLVVVLNKVDLLPEASRAKLLSKARKRLAATFDLTRFKGCAMVPVAASPAAAPLPTSAAPQGCQGSAALGVSDLVQELLLHIPSQARPTQGRPFLALYDHCFAIKGQGTVLTGTVLQGEVNVGDTIELPELKLTRKVKSAQMFKCPTKRAAAGDRVGMCVTQLDPSLAERGLLCTPGTLPTFDTVVVAVEKIRFFTGRVTSRSKLHVTIGHATVMAEATFFGLPDSQGLDAAAVMKTLLRGVGRMSLHGAAAFDAAAEYLYQDELYGLEARPLGEYLEPLPHQQARQQAAQQQQQQQEGGGGVPQGHYGPQWVLLRLQQPVTAPKDSLVIGARLDADADASTCRIAMHGRVVSVLPPDRPLRQALRIYKLRRKEGVMERVLPDGSTAVCRGMFKKETDMGRFTGMKVETATGETGTIQGSFGKSGKFKVAFPSGVRLPTCAARGNGEGAASYAAGQEEPGAGAGAVERKVYLTFKKFLFEEDRSMMVQGEG